MRHLFPKFLFIQLVMEMLRSSLSEWYFFAFYICDLRLRVQYLVYDTFGHFADRWLERRCLKTGVGLCQSHIVLDLVSQTMGTTDSDRTSYWYKLAQNDFSSRLRKIQMFISTHNVMRETYNVMGFLEGSTEPGKRDEWRGKRSLIQRIHNWKSQDADPSMILQRSCFII